MDGNPISSYHYPIEPADRHDYINQYKWLDLEHFGLNKSKFESTFTPREFQDTNGSIIVIKSTTLQISIDFLQKLLDITQPTSEADSLLILAANGTQNFPCIFSLESRSAKMINMPIQSYSQACPIVFRGAMLLLPTQSKSILEVYNWGESMFREIARLPVRVSRATKSLNLKKPLPGTQVD